MKTFSLLLMKAFSLCFFCIIFSLSAFAQERKFVGGLLAGVNGIQIAGDKEKKWGAGGVTAGVCVQKFVAKKLALQLELKYIQKGSIYPYVNDYGLQDWEVLRLHYIEIPLVVNYSVSKKTNFWYLQGGFAYANLFKKSFSETRMQMTNPPFLLEQYSDHDLSWIMGVGYMLNKGKLKRFSFLFRYSRSIIPIHEYLNHYNVVYGIALMYYLKFAN